MRHIAVHLIALLGIALPARAQVVTIDEGSFTISRNGERIGSEEFAIGRTANPGGDVLVAKATVTYDGRRVSPALRTDSLGAPLAYQVDVSSGTEVQERLRGRVGRGRFSAQVKTPRGESAKEYIVADGALILDDDIFHQYYFVGQGKRSGSVPVVIPRRNVQVSMRVVSRGPDAVVIGGTRVQGTHLVLTDEVGAARHIWVDERGRVLKVTLEGRGITALRDEPPR